MIRVNHYVSIDKFNIKKRDVPRDNDCPIPNREDSRFLIEHFPLCGKSTFVSLKNYFLSKLFRYSFQQ